MTAKLNCALQLCAISKIFEIRKIKFFELRSREKIARSTDLMKEIIRLRDILATVQGFNPSSSHWITKEVSNVTEQVAMLKEDPDLPDFFTEKEDLNSCQDLKLPEALQDHTYSDSSSEQD